MSLSFEPVKSPPFLSPYVTKDAKQRFYPPSSGKPTKATISNGRPSAQPSSLSSPLPLNRRQQFQCNSVSLSCLSPDSRSFHSLLSNGTIVTRFLPVCDSPNGGNMRNDNNELSVRTSLPNSKTSSNLPQIQSITTTLPRYIVESLQVDPPIEIICIDNHTPSKVSRSGANRHLCALPLLCIYSQRSAFVLQIQYEVAKYNSDEESFDESASELENDAPTDQHIKGTVLEPIHEPFESFLTTISGVIRRIRPAPHSYMYNGNTYQTLCNKGAMIMLASTGDVEGESSIVLFHGYDPIYDNNILQSWKLISTNPGNVTIPAKVHSEQTGMSSIVDFCFLPSMPLTEHSIWNAMTVVLCAENGSLYALSPVVFHNTVFPYHMIKDGRELLEKIVIMYEHSVGKGAECRRAKAALQFLRDVFGNAFNDVYNTKDSYAKTNVMHPSRRMNAVLWPVGLQTLQRETGLDEVKCMETIPSSCIVSSVMNSGGTSVIVVANNSTVDYMIIPSGTNILPRFAFESGEDRQYLDDMFVDSVVTIERISFGSEESDSEQGYAEDFTGRSIVLMLDPVDRSMLHRVSSQGVMTVSTNVVSTVEKRLRSILHIAGDSDDVTLQECETNAWPSIAMTKNPEKTLIGTVISGDSQFGHVLVATLDDGTIEAVNMTAALYLIEAKKQLDETSTTSHSSVMKDSKVALGEVERIKPLYQEIKPFFDQISSGLSNMTKIVGGSTQPKEVTAGALATFLAIKQASEQNIILPIKEMNSLLVSRKNYLQSMRDSQIEQVSQLREMMKVLKTRMEANADKKDVLESNAGLLSQRSAAVLSTVRDLSPSITEAERLYFADIKRYKAKCDKYESTLTELRRQYNTLSDDIKQGIENIELNADQVTSCFNLLDGQSDILQRIQTIVGESEEKMEKMVALSGLSDVGKC